MTATKTKFKKWDRFVADRFTYTHDKVENWRSHASELLDDKSYHMKDDCDGLASTVLDLLARDGVPLSQLWRCTVRSPQAKKNTFIDHMIGMAETDDGDRYIVGDTFNEGKPVPLRMCPHTIVETARLDEGIIWRSYQRNVATSPETPVIGPTFKYSKASKSRQKWLHPAMKQITDLALKKSSIDFGLTETRRSKAQQQRNLDAGASETLNSRHLMNYCYWKGRRIYCCHAVDVLAYIGRRGTYVPYELYEKIAKAFYDAAAELGYKITWGGEWQSMDGVHFQLDWGQFPIARRK